MKSFLKKLQTVLFPFRWIYLLLISMWIYGSFFSAFSITSGILSALLIYSIIILIIPIIIIEFIFYAIRKFNTCNSCHNNKNSSNLVSKEHSQNSELTNNNTQEHSTTYTVESKKIKDEDIPHLIEMGLQHAIEREKSSNNPKFHRTNKEEELSFQFINNHSTEIQNHIDSFESRYRLACQENQIDKKIELLQQTIELYEKAKNWFYRTRGGEIYFQDFFEYLHNSQNDCYSYITPIKKYLEECIYHRDYLIPEILNIIASHPNGILQKDIYTYIPSVSKNEIQKINNFLANRGDILKIKLGNSYLLTIRTQ